MNGSLTRSAEGYERRSHYGLAVYCAKRFAGRGVPMEELIGEAEAALLWAASRYDKARGVSFATYAIPAALGALRELCRRSMPLVVPRREMQLLCAVDSLRAEITASMGREATLAELAEKTGIAEWKLVSMLEARQRMRASFASTEPLMEPWDDTAAFENRILLKDVLRSLGKPYAQVLWLRYYAGMSQKEIAEKYQVSQSKISRWEKEGKQRLRAVW